MRRRHALALCVAAALPAARADVRAPQEVLSEWPAPRPVVGK